MPAQRRSMPDNLHDRHQFPDHRPSQPKQSRRDERELEQPEDEQDQGQPQKQMELEPGKQVEGDYEQVEDADEDDEEDEEEEEEEDDDDDDDDAGGKDSDESESSTSQEKPEFISVELPEIRKEVQCPICLGIIKKTRTVMECLHRFCRECIDKSMRLGNNECPACRTHCASRRSLRDDPNYDALIAALYPDIDKYEEEELAFHEEERTRNKQIQASIAQIFQRQSEALMVKRRVSTRSQRNQRSAHSRRRRNTRVADHHGSEDNEDENNDNGSKGSSSSEEPSSEMRQRQRKRRRVRSSQPCSSAINSDVGCVENDTEASRDSHGISPGLVCTPEILAWGRGGARSHTRHGNSSYGKNSRMRLNRLAEYLRCLQENNDELDIHLKLISLDKQSARSLQQPYLCCRPSLSVKQLREYIALQTPLQAEEVEIFLAKEESYAEGNKDNLNLSTSADELRILESQETLAGLKDKSTSSKHLILAYRQKQSS